MFKTIIKEDTKHKCEKCRSQSSVMYKVDNFKTYLCDTCWCDIVLADFAKQWVMYNEHKKRSKEVL